MNRYNIYCTEAQTKKAFELGAPIIILPNYAEFKGFPFVRCQNGNEYPCQIPTAEQMLGCLEEQYLSVDVFMCKSVFPEGIVWCMHISDENKHETILLTHNDNSRKEATLAAIDAALDYLSKNK